MHPHQGSTRNRGVLHEWSGTGRARQRRRPADRLRCWNPRPCRRQPRRLAPECRCARQCGGPASCFGGVRSRPAGGRHCECRRPPPRVPRSAAARPCQRRGQCGGNAPPFARDRVPHRRLTGGGLRAAASRAAASRAAAARAVSGAAPQFASRVSASLASKVGARLASAVSRRLEEGVASAVLKRLSDEHVALMASRVASRLAASAPARDLPAHDVTAGKPGGA